jgi:hypothetical protein
MALSGTKLLNRPHFSPLQIGSTGFSIGAYGGNFSKLRTKRPEELLWPYPGSLPPMPAVLASYTLVGIEAIPVDVTVVGSRARVIDRATGRVLHARRPGPGLAHWKSAPADLETRSY